MSTVDEPSLHITIGSVPQARTVETNVELDLRNDVEMVKASVLYADHATLYSIASSALFAIVSVADLPDAERWQFLERMSLLRLFDDDTQRMMDVMSAAHAKARRTRYSRKGAENLRTLKKALGEGWTDMAELAGNMIASVGGDGIAQAVSSGLLEVHAFESVIERTVQESKHREFVLEYLGEVSHAISNPHTYALFDEDTSEVISASIAAGIIPVTESGIARGKEVRLASDLFARLPLFPNATVKEIIAIRQELARPLTDFRAAMITFSDAIKHASWDEEFSSDVDQLFRRDVAPTILALEEEAKANTFLSNLASEFSTRSLQIGTAIPASSALSSIAVKMSDLPVPDLAALSIGPLLAVGGVVHSAYTKWRERQEEIKQNNLFFFYKAGKLLDDGTHAYVSDR